MVSSELLNKPYANSQHELQTRSQASQWFVALGLLLQVVLLVLSLSKTVSQRMSHQPSFDITDAAKRITSDVMGHLLYGEDLRGVTWE
jgi:hypothetical protein